MQISQRRYPGHRRRGELHAFVLVGYERTDPGTYDERIRFIRQDDEIGPYQVVDNYLFDDYSPWEYLGPHCRASSISGEEAEVIGAARLRAAYQRIGEALDPAATSFRATRIESNEFKTGLEGRGMDTSSCGLPPDADVPVHFGH